MSHLDALEQELRELKLTRLADQLQGFLADAAKQEWDYGTFLGNVVKSELLLPAAVTLALVMANSNC